MPQVTDESLNESLQIAKRAHLKYVSDKRLGYKRLKKGAGWIYLDTKGQVIGEQPTQDRINKLGIPPAWEKVWICPDESGHIQVTGRDERGRKQYIYHEDWNKQCQENKFSKMLFFGNVLPKIRRKVREDMSVPGLAKEKILATLVWLLGHTFIRIGNDEYAKDNQSYGLTTLRNKHIDFEPGSLTLTFKGKSGVEHIVNVTNPRIIKTIRKCVELPGYELFKYVDEDGRHLIDSSDVNEYLKYLTGEDISAKDFRTWGGSVLSAETLHRIGPFQNEIHLKKNVSAAVKEVSRHLRNTPAVCRNYYIHPIVIESYEEEILIPHFKRVHSKGDSPAELTLDEYATLTLLQRYS